MAHKKKLGMIAWLLLVAGCSIQPQPLTHQEIGERAALDMERLFNEPGPSADLPITLDQAIQRALTLNLNHWVKVMEETIALGDLNTAFHSLLPQQTISLEHDYRSKDAALTSRSLTSGITSTNYETSLEKSYNHGNVTVVWNFLDFGVSYIRARQQADKVLISRERRLKAIQEIIRDIRFAYWRAVSAEALLPSMEAQLQKARVALEKSRQMEQNRLQPAEKAMAYQENLLRQIQQITALHQELVQAKTQLAGLIHIRPGSPFSLDLSLRENLKIPEMALEPPQLEKLALVSRPELREEDYQERISGLDTKVAVLRMLPGLELSASQKYDGNRYLNHSEWVEVAQHLSLNLSNLIAAPAHIKTAEAQRQLAVTRRMAMTMAILTQVNLAHQGFFQARRNFDLANQMCALKNRQWQRAKAALSAQGGEPMEMARRQLESLVAEMQRDTAYAELQNAYGMVLHSVGLESLPHPKDVAGRDLHVLAGYASANKVAPTKTQNYVNFADSPPISHAKMTRWVIESHQDPQPQPALNIAQPKSSEEGITTKWRAENQ